MSQSTTDRIVAEKAAIAQAESRIGEFEAKRKQALLDSDGRALDAADAELNSTRVAVSRGLERIELLESRLNDEREQARNAELDALAARATKAREVGEKLISTKYAAAARQISTVLGQLSAIDEFIAQANRELGKADRPILSSTNTVRCRPPQTTEVVERQRLGVGNPEHPYHGRAEPSQIRGKARVTATGEYIDSFGEFDVRVVRRVPGHFPEALQNTVVLPSVEPDAPPFWPPGEAVDPHAVLAELGLSDNKPGLVASLRAAIAPRAA
jgi:hypothetical protein